MRTPQELLKAVQEYCKRHGSELKEWQISAEGVKPVRLLGGTEDWTLIEAKITFNEAGKPKTTFKVDGKVTSIKK